MPAQIITTDDLREFKIELLEDIKNLLQTLRINGTLPYTKIGGIILYDAGEIDKVMKENSVHNKF